MLLSLHLPFVCCGGVGVFSIPVFKKQTPLARLEAWLNPFDIVLKIIKPVRAKTVY